MWFGFFFVGFIYFFPLFKWVSSSHQVARVLDFQLQDQSFQWTPGLISFRMDWLDLLAIQGTFKSLLQHHSSNASILQRSAFFTVQLSQPYMTTGKTIVKSLNRVWLFATTWTGAHQAPPSLGFSRQEYWNGLPFPSSGDLPDPGIEPPPLLAGGFPLLAPLEKPTRSSMLC